MVAAKVNCYLTVLEVESLQLSADYLLMSLDLCGLQNELRVPVADVLVYD